ncbi:rRNA methyltransferase [Actinotalea fermentans ATCC 43279 = JCM 9966 = DSM 3133]|uniref:rRNA methyltransferase n=1 Tax=Actinotalea fermentans TaxID=43671 RepID=A0A511YVC3_9CELL|nr:RNA methyltransferase [Actinotalea fermentans]KGM16576.1 rRNA methyltransferase [Actinotalea fermentans ATCC 43279 = JCM 9966 = DSM 3133]GEN79137.1 rRNA methyltransferase [Actinotalea fermentans]
MPIIRLTDLDDERLADYTRLTDVALRRRLEPERGLYMAESTKVILRALEAGHRPRSFLMTERWLPELADLLADVEARFGDVPVYVGPAEIVETLTGFHLHRGALAAMQRPELPAVADLLSAARGGAGARRVAVLEGIVDHTNVGTGFGFAAPPRRIAIFEDVVDHSNLGAGFRSAAALGVDAVLVTPRCADPLYRRSIRVSMGTVFQVPWTRIDPWPDGLEELRLHGFTVAALALSDSAVPLDDFSAALPDRLALVLGTEGDGLSRHAIDAADVVVRIPMAASVDSLNVAAAAAVAFWETRPK